MFDTQTTFSAILSNIEALWKLKQTRNLADDNLFRGLRVKVVEAQVPTYQHILTTYTSVFAINGYSDPDWWRSLMNWKQMYFVLNKYRKKTSLKWYYASSALILQLFEYCVSQITLITKNILWHNTVWEVFQFLKPGLILSLFMGTELRNRD